MGKVILGVTISLDGFAEDQDGSVRALYPDLDALKKTDYLNESIRSTGAVVMSKKEFETAEDPDSYADNYEYQVPIFIFTDEIPEKHPKETDQLTLYFVLDGIASAVNQAKIAAGEKDVNIIGSARTVQLCLQTDVADELQVDILPVFLKAGARPFDQMEDLHIKLQRILTLELPEGRTHLSFKIMK